MGTTIDGATFDLATLRGRWVLINFFATWSIPCRQEHPDLVRFDERHQAIGDARVPESFLIAPDGTVVAKLIGGIRDVQLERLLTEATGGTPDGQDQ